jgi:hypothetical protein
LGGDEQAAAVEAVGEGAAKESEEDSASTACGADESDEEDPLSVADTFLDPEDLGDELERHERLGEHEPYEEEPEFAHP